MGSNPILSARNPRNRTAKKQKKLPDIGTLGATAEAATEPREPAGGLSVAMTLGGWRQPNLLAGAMSGPFPAGSHDVAASLRARRSERRVPPEVDKSVVFPWDPPTNLLTHGVAASSFRTQKIWKPPCRGPRRFALEVGGIERMRARVVHGSRNEFLEQAHLAIDPRLPWQMAT
jgi:hypothetical protein